MTNTAIYPETIERYNRPGPRYTSYPTVPVWEQGHFGKEYIRFLQEEGQHDYPLSVYVHLPFCKTLCTFCGCNRFIPHGKDIVDLYVDALEAEIQLIAQHMGHRKSVQQLHFGGGTPTHLDISQLQRLMDALNTAFEIEPDAEMAVEIHPRVTSGEQLEALHAMGFRRLSLGVQDLDWQVQKAINRRQTLDQTQRVFQQARTLGYDSINIDLVYGLPRQTRETFHYTMEEVLKMRPDRLAIYNFAYMPKQLPHQQAIRAEELPSVDERVAIYIDSIHTFTEAGYVMIGMDHYAEPHDELALAKENQTLHRNFMGYTTLHGLTQLGIGVSAISDFGHGYFQTEKDLSAYMLNIQQRQLPVIRHKSLDLEDRIRRNVIETLMCHGYLSLPAVEAQYQLSFEDYFTKEMPALNKLAEEGLLEFSEDRLSLTPLGTLFMRNVAMVFDEYLPQNTEGRFSRTV